MGDSTVIGVQDRVERGEVWTFGAMILNRVAF